MKARLPVWRRLGWRLGASVLLLTALGILVSVAGFTLEPSIGEFLLSHPSIRVPGRGRTSSVNEGHARLWPPAIRTFVDALKAPGAAGGGPHSARYSGALVADVHRTLLEGGVYLYPP
jgi:fructose-1,6-bisphosphatase I